MSSRRTPPASSTRSRAAGRRSPASRCTASGRIAETLILCFDGDDAGRAAATRAVDVIAAEGLQARICRLPAGVKDPDELVRRDPAAFAAGDRRGAAGVAGAPRRRARRGRGRQRRRASRRSRTSGLGAGADPRGDDARALSPAGGPAARHRRAVADAPTWRTSMRDGARRPARIVVAAPAETGRRRRRGTGEPLDADEPMPAWEAQLARVVLIRPELAAGLRGRRRPGDPTSSPIRPPGASSTRRARDPAGFTLRRLSGGDQRRAAGLLVREVPEFADEAEPEAIKQLMADCVRLIHEESVRRALVSISTRDASCPGRGPDRGCRRARGQAEPPCGRRAASAPHTGGTLIAAAGRARAHAHV